MPCPRELPNAHRLVGDPVDVVTGANTEVARDFRLPGAVPLDWRRHYSSARAAARHALGRGHTHAYDRALRFDLDGMRYVGPLGAAVPFPALPADGDLARSAGLTLRRLGAHRYEVSEADGTVTEFVVTDGARAAPPAALLLAGARAEFWYGEDGRLAAIDLGGGRTVRVSHTPAGEIRQLVLVDAAGRADLTLAAYEYDAAGNLVGVRDAYGLTLSFAYDAGNRMVRRTDRRGYSFHFAYDEAGRCVHSRGEDGAHEVRLSYRPAERRTVVTQADGGVWTYAYDEAGAVTEISGPCGARETIEYDDQGRVAAVTDEHGDVTRRVYDDRGALLGTVLPAGEFAADGAAPRVRHPAHGRVPLGPLQWEYGRVGLARAADAPAIDAPAIDAPARAPIAPESLAPAGAVADLPLAIQALARSDGNLGLAGAPAPGAAAPVYDALGTLLQTQGLLGGVRRYAYDANGSVRRIVDADGRSYLFDHASADFRHRTVDPLGHASTSASDAVGRLTAFADPAGGVSRYRYDLRGRLVAIGRHGQTVDVYTRGRGGGVAERHDGQGALVAATELGPGGLVLARRFASGAEHRFAYDEHGRVVSAADEEGETTAAYNALGALTADLRDGTGVEHRYSRFGRRVATTVFGRFTTDYLAPAPHVRVVRDPTGREHRVELAGPHVYRRTLANGTTEIAGYAPAGVCAYKAVGRGHGPGAWWVRRYAHSAEGDLLHVDDSRAGHSSYEYDAAHRLTASHGAAGEGRFEYDPAGNLTTQPGLARAEFGEGNRLLSADGATFDHDARHRVCARRGRGAEWRYEHDALGRLVRASSEGVDWAAGYDALGRRVWTRSAGATTRYAWDADRLAAEVGPDGALRVYVYADEHALSPIVFVDYAGVDADPASGRAYYLFHDHLAAPVRVEDDAGRAVWSARREPYGRTAITRRVGDGPPVDLRLRLPGHHYDPETGLHYNGARYYSPDLGRYLEPDPWGVNGGPNLYAYTPNPLLRVDVRGLCPVDEPTKTTPPPAPDEEGTTPGSERPTLPPGAMDFAMERVNGGSVVIMGTTQFVGAVKADIQRMQGVPAGLELLARVEANHRDNGTQIVIQGPISPPTCRSPEASRHSPTSSDVMYTPQNMDPSARPQNAGTDAVLFHEMSHGEHAQRGASQTHLPATSPGYPNREEQVTVAEENEYRRQCGNPPRADHRDPG